MDIDLNWLSSKQFQSIAGIGESAAREALSKCFASELATWHGVHLRVRRVAGVGGTSGKAYQVDASSLPLELATKWLDMHPEFFKKQPEVKPPPVAMDLEVTDVKAAANPYLLKAMHIAEWKFELIKQALAMGGRWSRGRTEILRGVIARNPHTRPDGSKCEVTMKGLKNWIHQYETEGLPGLMRKSREGDAPRRIVSMSYDRLCPLSDDIKREIWSQVEYEIKSILVHSNTPLEGVRQLANVLLVELSHKYGWPAATLENCDVGIGQVRTLKHLRTVAIRSLDNKRFRDQFVPRIVRNRLGYRPMDLVMGDVHPVDILKTREDGIEVDGEFLPNGSFLLFDQRRDKEETATARMISWFDVATGRYCADYILLGKRQGVNQAMVVASFVRMTQMWGFPARLYLDNGSEYKWKPFVEGYQKLARMVARRQNLKVSVEECDSCELAQIVNEVAETEEDPLTRAKPHNPQGKAHKEGLYGVLERTVFCMVDGWIGGDRMNQRTHQVGKAPRAFNGTWREFLVAMETCSRYYHSRKQRDGKSPDMRYAEFRAEGWEPTRIPYSALLMAFSEELYLTVRNNGITVGINRYWHDAMASPMAMGQKVRVYVAKWDPDQIIIVIGTQAVFAQRDAEFALLDRAGAKEQYRRESLLNQQLSAIKRGVLPGDMLARMERFSNLAGPAPAIPIGQTLALSPEHRQLEDALQQAGEPPEPKKITLMAGQYLTADDAIRSELEDIPLLEQEEEDNLLMNELERLGSDANWRPPGWQDDEDDKGNARSSWPT